MKSNLEGKCRGLGICKCLLSILVLAGVVLLPSTVLAEGNSKEEIWVNGVNILEDADRTVECGGGTAVYDAASRTLTLSDTDITKTANNGSAILVLKGSDIPEKVTVKLQGTNDIYPLENESIDMGIYSMGQISIIGEGSLDITTRNNNNTRQGGVYAFGGCDIDGITLTIRDESEKRHAEAGIDSNQFENGHCSIQNSVVVIEGYDCGINVPSNNISIKGSSITANNIRTAIAGGENGTFVIENSTLDLSVSENLEQGETPRFDAIGILSGADVTIKKSSVNIKSPTSNGIFTRGGITVNDTSVFKIESYYPALYGSDDIVIDNSEINAATKDSAIYSESNIIIQGDSNVTANGYYAGLNANGDITIQGGDVSSVSSNDLGIYLRGVFTVNAGKVYAKGAEGFAAVGVGRNRQSEDEEAVPGIVIGSGYAEKNGSKIAVSDWYEWKTGIIRSWTSFIPQEDEGPLQTNLGNAVNEITIEEKAPQEKTGVWKQNKTGWWYEYADGTYPVSQWKYIDNTWYYFNGAGYMATGWLKQENTWYYLKSSGAMATGWYKVGKYWYYSKENGAMVTGWLLDGNTWYYLRSDGSMATGWYMAGGKWYYSNGSGAMQTGWLKQGKIWYYLKADGAMATGWCLDGNTWYYFNGSGVMQTGWIKLGNTWYYLKASGAMQTGWLKQGKIWYYLKADGAMATGWYLDGNTWYYSNGSGGMQTGWLKQGNTWYYLKSSGAMAVGWCQVGSTWYYFKESGAMVTGWIKDGNAWYYLNPSGAMAANRWIGNYYVGASGAMYVSRYTPDGYYVDSDGVWIKLGDDDIDFDLDRVVTKYFYMTVPESWDEPVQYGAIEKMWIAMYATAFKNESGEDDYEPLFGVVAAKTKQEAELYMAELKNPKNLGQHSGMWFVAGQDKESAIGSYGPEQQAEILKLQGDIPGILNSIVFR